MALLAEQVDAHAHAPDGLGAIQLADALDAVEVVSGQTASQLLAIVVRQRCVAVHARVLKTPGQAELHGQTAHQVHVGSTCLARHVYDMLNVHAWSFSFGLLLSPRFWHPPSSSLLQRGDGFAGFLDGGHASQHQLAAAVLHRLERARALDGVLQLLARGAARDAAAQRAVDH